MQDPLGWRLFPENVREHLVTVCRIPLGGNCCSRSGGEASRSGPVEVFVGTQVAAPADFRPDCTRLKYAPGMVLVKMVPLGWQHRLAVWLGLLPLQLALGTPRITFSPPGAARRPGTMPVLCLKPPGLSYLVAECGSPRVVHTRAPRISILAC